MDIILSEDKKMYFFENEKEYKEFYDKRESLGDVLRAIPQYYPCIMFFGNVDHEQEITEDNEVKIERIFIDPIFIYVSEIKEIYLRLMCADDETKTKTMI